jgi:hypothetical protein
VTPLEAIKKLELHVADLGENFSVDGVTDVVEAHEIVEAVEQLRRSVTLVIEMWRGREVVLLQAAGGRTDLGINATIRVAPKFEERYDHDLIGAKVIDKATRIVQDDGEVIYVDDPEVAADRAVAIMRAVYVSPATKPKKTALVEKLGFEKAEGALASRVEVGKATKVRPT